MIALRRSTVLADAKVASRVVVQTAAPLMTLLAPGALAQSTPTVQATSTPPTSAPVPTLTPSDPSRATSIGPPDWYTRAYKAVGSALNEARTTVQARSAAQRHTDVPYLDKLTELLRGWEGELQKLADPFRKSRFH